ncbi:hypothetical protein ABE10_02030, partial [Bacillus toyonensis]|nr:hypothetical protein [Bacillus toyonensis]
LEVVRHVERAQHHTGDLVMTERVHVETVVSEEARVLDHLEPPLIGDDTVVPVRDRPHVLVIDRDLATERAEDRREVRVDAGEQHDGRSRAGQPGHGVVEEVRDLIRIR